MTPLLNLQSGEDNDSKAHIAGLHCSQDEACSNQYHAVALDISGYGTYAPCLSSSFRFPTTSGGSGQSSVSQMARSSSASRTVTCWFARMQAVQATTIRRLMAGTD